MKFFLLAFAFVLFISSCKNSNSTTASTKGAESAAADTGNYTSVVWLDSLVDLGRLKFGETKQINFRFRNNGDKPLFILSAVPGCGCTVSDFPKEAIAPGKEGVITAAFDTNKGHEGEFRKNINVTTNTKENTTQVLYFMGTIYKEENTNSEGPKAGA